jgi:hypothetical protein
MSGNTKPFRKDIRVEQSSLNVDPSPIFNSDTNDKDSPGQFIKKMERTVSKKTKNNYKNITELENIYDTKPPANSENKDSTDTLKPGELTETFDEIGKSMGYLIKSLTGMTTGKKDGKKDEKKDEKKGDKKDGKKGGKKGDKKNKKSKEPTIEGFSNNYSDNYKRLYKPHYEYDKKWKSIGSKEYAELEEKAKSGLLNTTKLK